MVAPVGPVAYAPGTFVEYLPFGARVVYVRGHRCWVHQGTYYRPHPRGYGYVTFRF